MTRWLHGWTGIVGIGAWLATAGPVEASPPYARTADGGLLSRARGKSDDDVVALQHDASGRLTREDCALELDVVNQTSRIRWNIVVIVGQRLSSGLTVSGMVDTDPARLDRTTIRIPYLPPREATTIRVPCLSAARHDYSNRTIKYGVEATSSAELVSAIVELATTTLPNTLSSPIVPSNDGHSGLDAMLALDDAAVAAQLVETIAAHDIGVDRLLAAIAAAPQSNLAGHAGPVFEQLSPALQVAVARTMLGAPELAARNERLLIRHLAAVCADRVQGIALWVAAQNEPGLATPRLRRAIASYCRPVAADLEVLEATVLNQLAGTRLIDQADPALFAAMVSRWRAAPPAFLAGYLADTANASRFDALIALVTPPDRAAVVTAFARRDDDALHDHRLRWVHGVIRTADRAQLEAIARSLFELDATGKVGDRDYAGIVLELRAAAPDVATDVEWRQATERNSVFDTIRLAAAPIDRKAFGAYIQSGVLDHCGTSLDAVVACARSIAGSGVSGLKPLIATALKPAFAAALRDKLHDPSDGDIAAANELVTVGWDLGFLAEALCAKARTSGASAEIERARQLIAARACVQDLEAEAADQARAAARGERAMTVAGILGLILPLAIGAVIARRWIRRRLQEPEPAVEAPAVVDRDARLGARLARGLADGAARAHRELSIAAAGDAVVAQAAATVRRAVSAGVAASRLVRDGNATFYLLALPVGDAPSEVFQRHLGAPWPEHAHQVHELAGSAIDALIVLCGPDAMTATLLVGRSDAASNSAPDALLDARDARVRRANSFRHAISLAE